MNKWEIIPGDIYMGRDLRTPLLLITNRLYVQKHTGTKTVLAVAPPNISSARRASDTERAQKTWEDSGYLVVKPITVQYGKDHYGDMLKINLQSLLDEDRMPIPEMLPPGYEIHMITSLAAFKGDYREMREQQVFENEQAAKKAKEARAAYNTLVDTANTLLGDLPLTRLERSWDATPERFELSAAQLTRILGMAS